MLLKVIEEDAATQQLTPSLRKALARAQPGVESGHREPELHGVDYLRMTCGGRVAEFHVMVRPLAALTALARAVTERMRASGRPLQ
jgi:hypothetical protein